MAEEGAQKNVDNEKRRQISEAEFLSWKRRKDAEISSRRAETARKRAEDIASGAVQMNGQVIDVMNVPFF
ncbi:hypothetical protein KSP40_PGU012366 [Platanthera guangdongensis]|uniref:ZC3H15/TMA46 family C-terminal domain-containing protein n=1 Tax=Platanthera guangdongensis TaxID=2320717 RepID=A0ABR2N4D4_9ASPA